MTLRPLALVLAGAALLGLNQTDSAQVCVGNPCSLTNAASVTVPVVLKLSLSSASTALTAPDSTAFNQGHQDDLSALTATVDRKSTRLNSSHGYISYAVFCLKKKTKQNININGLRVGTLNL